MPHRRHGSGRFSFMVWLARSPLLDAPRLPQQEMLDDQIPLAADEWCQRHVISRSTFSGPALTLNALQLEQWNEDGWSATMIDTLPSTSFD